jgi:enolase
MIFKGKGSGWPEARTEAMKTREILDLHGNPTAEVDVYLSGGARAVAANMGQIKLGPAPRSDRMTKYSQLRRIKEERLRRNSEEQRSFIA